MKITPLQINFILFLVLPTYHAYGSIIKYSFRKLPSILPMSIPHQVFPRKYSYRPKIKSPHGAALRASPQVLSMWLHTVNFIAKKSKCTGLAQEIGLLSTKFVQFAVADKGRHTVVDLHKRV
jgi:hypothetical protein